MICNAITHKLQCTEETSYTQRDEQHPKPKILLSFHDGVLEKSEERTGRSQETRGLDGMAQAVRVCYREGRSREDRFAVLPAAKMNKLPTVTTGSVGWKALLRNIAIDEDKDWKEALRSSQKVLDLPQSRSTGV